MQRVLKFCQVSEVLTKDGNQEHLCLVIAYILRVAAGGVRWKLQT